MRHVIPVAKDIKLSVAARYRVCKELQKSPALREYVAEPASIVYMTKDDLLSLAEKCEIDVEEIVEEVRRQCEGQGVLTSEEMERRNYSERYPAFEGAIRVPLSFDLGGRKCRRLFRVKYSYTPAWEYYDVQKEQLMNGWEGWTREYEIWATPGKNWVGAKPRWISADTLAEIGVLSEAQENLIDELIEKRCREEDKRRRKAAGLSVMKRRSAAADSHTFGTAPAGR